MSIQFPSCYLTSQSKRIARGWNATKYSSSLFGLSRNQARTFGWQPGYFAKLLWKVIAISKHYAPSFPSFFCSQYLAVWLSSVRFPLFFSSFALFDWPRVLFEKCRRRIPPVSILYLQTVSISFFPSLTLTLFLLHAAFFSLTFTHRFASFTHFTVHFSFSFFTLLRFPLQRLWLERFLRFPISPSRIWSFLLFNAHTSCPLYNNPRQAPCGLRRQIYRQVYRRLREGQVPPQQDSCLPASEGVAWISYSWHGPAALIYENLSRRGN